MSIPNYLGEDMKDQMKMMARGINEKEEEIKELKAEKNRISAAKIMADEQVRQLVEQRDTMAREMAEKVSQLAEQQSKLEKSEDTVSKFRKQSFGMAAELEELKAEKKKLQADATRINTIFCRAEAKFKQFGIKQNEVEKTNKALRENFSNLSKAYADLRDNYLELKSAVVENENSDDINSLKAQLSASMAEVANLQEMLSAKSTEVENLMRHQSWFEKEEKDLGQLKSITFQIKDILSKRVESEIQTGNGNNKEDLRDNGTLMTGTMTAGGDQQTANEPPAVQTNSLVGESNSPTGSLFGWNGGFSYKDL